MSDSIEPYIGQKGYSIPKECMEVDDQIKLRNDLTVRPYVPKTSLAKPNPFPVYRESNKKLYIPKFYGVEEYGEVDKIKLSDGHDIDLRFDGELRDHQIIAVEKYIKSALSVGGGLLELHTGAGKTVVALNIISRLNKKTLIIVHKEFLLRQWVERIEQFLPDARVGTIKQNIIETEDKDIVIGMLQSLSMKDYPIEMFNEYGLTIVDECHHISSEVFSRALFKIVTKYTLGLSATMKRKDGLTKVIKWFLGDIVYTKKRKGEDKVLVKAILYESNDDEFNEDIYNWKGQIKYTSMIKKLCEFNRRSEFILKLLKDMIDNGKDEDQIMILAHNKSLLQYLYDAIKHRNIATVGYYIGGMKEIDLKISEGKKIIIGTYAMAEEGLDIKTLNTLLMATPKVDVTQAVGRILRKKGHEAVVYDILDTHGIFDRHWKKRLTFYKRQKFKVIHTTSKLYEKNEWTTLIDNNISKPIKQRKKKTTIETMLNGTCFIDDED